jgi:hypothetical protein
MLKLTILFMLASVAAAADPSDYFMMGKDSSELVSAYSKKTDFLTSPQQVSFRDEINGIACTFVYLLKNGKSVSALCFVRTENLKFSDATKQYSSLVEYFLGAKKISSASLRINGVPILGGPPTASAPLNYIRVSGEWTSEYNFEATLDGSSTEKSMETSGVSGLGLTIGIKTFPPRGP